MVPKNVSGKPKMRRKEICSNLSTRLSDKPGLLEKPVTNHDSDTYIFHDNPGKNASWNAWSLQEQKQKIRMLKIKAKPTLSCFFDTK
jgi:hypothetical protein